MAATCDPPASRGSHAPRDAISSPIGADYPIRVSKIYTRTGDDGTTGLLYGTRISKADPAAEAYGSVDETVADIGVARALSDDHDLGAILLEIQRALFVVGADLATNPKERSKLRPGVSLVTAEMVEGLESQIDRHEGHLPPRGAPDRGAAGGGPRGQPRGGPVPEPPFGPPVRPGQMADGWFRSAQPGKIVRSATGRDP